MRLRHASISGRFFSQLIGAIDRALRRIYGIREFEREDDGLLRIAICRAQRELILSDGIRIRRGDSVVDLHIWNEHLPCFPATVRDFGWAARVRRQALSSLDRLRCIFGQTPISSEFRRCAWRPRSPIDASTNRLPCCGGAASRG
jgi:hypothetical protein